MNSKIVRENVTMGIGELSPYEMNSKVHNAAQVDKIAKSLKEFGWISPVIIDEENTILAGHGRVLAAKKCGIDTVPCVRISGLSDMQKKAYIIADNKLSEDAGWDFSKLKTELEALVENGYDSSLSGFSLDGSDFDYDLSIALSEDIYETGESQDAGDQEESRYTRKIDGIKYESTRSPELTELVDKDKYNELIAIIDNALVTDDEKEFLRCAASRFYKFDYASIADYYCHSSEEMQIVMEELALVIIDFDKAIEKGIVRLGKNLERYRIENDA
jgi:hypothetical protein